MITPSSCDIESVIEALARGPRIIIPLVREVPGAILKRRRAPDKWSAHEHACHLPAVQPIMIRRLDYMLADPDPVIEPYNPASDNPEDALLRVDLDEAMDRFARERRSMIDRLQCLTEQQWGIQARHDEYSHYSVFIMFRHLGLHDLYHAYRIEERLLSKEWT